MAVPLLHGERVLGVLQVLDRPQDRPFSLSEMDVLGLFAHQAAIALDLLGRARRGSTALEGGVELRRGPEDRRDARCAAARARRGRLALLAGRPVLAP